jgi:hypothetical protein
MIVNPPSFVGHRAWVRLAVCSALLFASSCNSHEVRRAMQPREAVAPSDPAPAEDPEYRSQDEVFARHLEWHERLLWDAPLAFARLEARQRAILGQLREDSIIHSRIYVLGPRALVIPPARHPAGSLELLIALDRAELVVFTRDHWAHRLPLARLPDVIDRSSRSERGAFTVDNPGEHTQSVLRPWPGGAPLQVSRHPQRLSYKYRSAQEPGAWSIRTDVEVLTRSAPERSPTDALIYALVLPQLQTRQGRLVAESLAQMIGTPLAWTRNVTNESFTGAPRARIRARLSERGWVEMPTRRFSILRDGFRSAGRLGPPPQSGEQLVAPEKLRSLRKGKDAHRLTVDNHSSTAALVFVDGALVGWVAPRKKFAIAGLRAGYYRIHAVAPSGIRAWGPFDSYIPGTVRLR